MIAADLCHIWVFTHTMMCMHLCEPAQLTLNANAKCGSSEGTATQELALSGFWFAVVTLNPVYYKHTYIHKHVCVYTTIYLPFFLQTHWASPFYL